MRVNIIHKVSLYTNLTQNTVTHYVQTSATPNGSHGFRVVTKQMSRAGEIMSVCRK